MAELSPRQREILDLVAAGRTSKDIAGVLGISESTVNWHISNTFTRLGASSRAEAVALAIRGENEQGANGEIGHRRQAGRRSARPPLPLSSVMVAFALTLLLGLVSGAIIAGWDLTAPPPPSSPVLPSSTPSHSVNSTVTPTRAGVGNPGTGPAAAEVAPAAPSLPLAPPSLP